MSRPVLLVDNLDSFSFNLVEAFERLGASVRVVRNHIGAAEAFAMADDEIAWRPMGIVATEISST